MKVPVVYQQTIIYQHRIFRRDLQLNPDVLYVFGDNEVRKGFGGQAAECRDEPNAVGVRTKRTPWETEAGKSAFWSDDTYDENVKMIDEDMQRVWDYNGIVVYPSDGIGTGLSELPERAPKTFAYLQSLGLGGKGGEDLVQDPGLTEIAADYADSAE